MTCTRSSTKFSSDQYHGQWGLSGSTTLGRWCGLFRPTGLGQWSCIVWFCDCSHKLTFEHIENQTMPQMGRIVFASGAVAGWPPATGAALRLSDWASTLQTFQQRRAVCLRVWTCGWLYWSQALVMSLFASLRWKPRIWRCPRLNRVTYGWHMGDIWCLDLAPRFTASYRVHHFDAMWGLHGAASKWSSCARRHSQIIPTQALVSWWAVCWWQAQSLVRQMGAVGHLGGTASLAALPTPSQTLQPCTFQITVNPFNIFQHPKPSLHWAKALSFDGACKMLRGISALGVARRVRYQAVDLWL